MWSKNSSSKIGGSRMAEVDVGRSRHWAKSNMHFLLSTCVLQAVEDVDCPGSEIESVGSLRDDDHNVQGSLGEVTVRRMVQI